MTPPRFARGAMLAAALLAACSSPNRGKWSGTFDGSVAGTVDFTINARGTALEGKMEGATTDGAPFHATMKGTIRDNYFYANFEGRTDTGLRPIPFTGFMKGEPGAARPGVCADSPDARLGGALPRRSSACAGSKHAGRGPR